MFHHIMNPRELLVTIICQIHAYITIVFFLISNFVKNNIDCINLDRYYSMQENKLTGYRIKNIPIRINDLYIKNESDEKYLKLIYELDKHVQSNVIQYIIENTSNITNFNID